MEDENECCVELHIEHSEAFNRFYLFVDRLMKKIGLWKKDRVYYRTMLLTKWE